METFFSVVGVLALAGILVILVLAFLIYRKIKKFLGALTEIFGGGQPDAITLVEGEFPTDDGDVVSRVLVFEGQGFDRVGAYAIEEMEGVVVVGLVHEAARLSAVVYRHPQAGVWSDVVVNYEPEGSLTVTNAPMGHELDHRPGHDKRYDKALDERALLERMASEARPGERRPAVAADFRAEFEKAYAEDMAWRNERGGPTQEEIERVAEGMDGEFSPEQIAQARQILAEQAGPKLEAALLQAFAATMSGAEWERSRHRSVIVRADGPTDEVGDSIFEALDAAELTDRHFHDVERAMDASVEGDGDPHAMVLAVNAVLPPEHRFRPKATVTEPAEAVLYVLS